jgi:CRP-like cAMP-binding protein
VHGVLANPPADVVVDEFGDSAVVYGLRYWINDIAREDVIEGEVRTRVWYAAQRARLEIPFPIRSVYMTHVTDEQLTREQELEFLERVAALSRIDLFAPLEEHDRETLAKGMRHVSFARGEEIIRQGEPGDSLYLIHEGEVSVRLNVEGVEREVATLDAGKFFGEMSLLTGEPRRATCSAKNDVQCYVVDQRAFRLILDAKPSIAEEISSLLGTRQMALEGEREGLSAEVRARRAADASSRVLSKIRDFFHLG